MHKKTAFNIGMMTFCNISVRVLGMLYKLYLASAVSPVALGIYQLVMPLYFVFSAPIASGLPLAASRLTAQTGRREAVLSSALRVALLPLCLCTLIMLSACGIIASLFLHDKSKYMLVLALIPAVVLGSVADIFAGSMHGTGKSYYPAICSCIEQILKIAFALAAVSLFGDFTESDAIFPVLALSFGGIVSFILMYTRSGKVSLKKSGYERDVFLTAYPPTLSRLFTSLLHLCTTSILPLRLISNGFTRTAALAQYGILTSISYPVIYLPMTLLGSVATVSLVSIAKSSNDFSAVRKKYIKALAFAFFVTVAFSVFLLLFAPALSDKLFHQPLAGRYSIILIPSVIFSGMNTITFSTLNGLGKQKQLMLLSLADGIIGLVLTYLLAGKFGIYGFIIGNCVQDMIAFIMGISIIIKIGKQNESNTRR